MDKNSECKIKKAENVRLISEEEKYKVFGLDKKAIL